MSQCVDERGARHVLFSGSLDLVPSIRHLAVDRYQPNLRRTATRSGDTCTSRSLVTRLSGSVSSTAPRPTAPMPAQASLGRVKSASVVASRRSVSNGGDRAREEALRRLVLIGVLAVALGADVGLVVEGRDSRVLLPPESRRYRSSCATGRPRAPRRKAARERQSPPSRSFSSPSLPCTGHARRICVHPRSSPIASASPSEDGDRIDRRARPVGHRQRREDEHELPAVQLGRDGRPAPRGRDRR